MKGKKINRFFNNFDFPLFTVAYITAIIGILMISSAVKSFDNNSKYITVQVGALLIGTLLMYIIMRIDYQNLSYINKYLFGFGVILLILVLTPLGTGREETGGQSWFRIGFISFQPAELVKLVFLITFSTHLSKIKEDINEFRNIFLLTLHFGVFATLIMLQPDTGTTMVYAFMFIIMLYAAGLSYKYFAWFFALLAALSPLVWFFLLKEYQKNRIIAVFKPEEFVSDYGYQVVQSKIAIGSGKFFGKGYFNGTQTQLGILPEKQTDFIFAVVGEEFGLVGCIIIIALLTSIIVRCIKIGKNSSTDLGRYMCTGIAAMFTFQAFENIGMCLGLTPVVGITLPFLSYGGSSLLTNLAALGIVLSVRQKGRINY